MLGAPTVLIFEMNVGLIFSPRFVIGLSLEEFAIPVIG